MGTHLQLATLPNAITASRLVLAPLTLAAHQLATAGGPGFEDASELRSGWLICCLVGLVLAEISDVIDGMVARRTDSVSDTGKLLDPLSDSIFRQLVFLGFLVCGWLPLWMMVIFFTRDILVAYLRIFAALHGVVLAARTSGKVKAVAQATAQISLVALFILHAHGAGEQLFGVPLPMERISWWLLLGAAATTLWSAVDYSKAVWTEIVASPDA